MLSSRGTKKAELMNIPWRYAPPHTYDKEMNPAGLISFGTAEHRASSPLFASTQVTFTENSIGYGSSSSTSSRLPNAVASHLNNILKPLSSIDPETVIIASGVTAIGNMLGLTLAEPSDGILVSRPVYGRFELDYGVEADIQIVYADTDPEEAFTPAVIEKYDVALKRAQKQGIRIRAMLIVNPHNPLGRCYPTETLKEILRFCHNRRLHLISDEIYASCVFDSGDPTAVPFTSALAISTPELIDPNLVHLLYGFSKDFASGGLRLGFLVTANAPLRQACKAILRLHSPSTASITIAATLLEDQAFVTQFTRKSRLSLASTYRIATSTLDQEGINYVKGGNAGFFVYIDLSPYLPEPGRPVQEREFALAQRFLDAKVFLHPGEEHAREAGWFRLVFAHDEGTLRVGLGRLIGVLRSS
ncbi:pyridoxal phosphate-dependent transferase [Aspergillus alliaceus]|uniref:pyridoxal phosphate-dependent transferase n=1 Tax=Petromyces alliaceus TaxID=209559 RepID=UPI0012A73F82|nr:pyridoxal phosphate-dependent transferase [Aspergillus alliaceus]KAB8229725.1 pyridoxal phosphate-dependent transferase [Aspergillus alliaceus]